jgi:hypothetical protein
VEHEAEAKEKVLQVYVPVSGKAVVEKPACQQRSLQHRGGEVAKSEICASVSCVRHVGYSYTARIVIQDIRADSYGCDLYC